MEFTEASEFQKDKKRLRKKYRSLDDDLEVVKKAIAAMPTGDGSKHWNKLHQIEDIHIMKMRVMCRSVRGAQFRLVYRYKANQVTVLCIELYYKGDQERENAERIVYYLEQQ